VGTIAVRRLFTQLETDTSPEFDVFISYSSKDKAVADAVVAAHENTGIRCWYAPRDIPPGADWGESITKAIERCSLMVLIFSGSANQSQRVLDELNYAVSRGKPILPFRVEDLEPTGAMGLHLSSRHWLDAFDPGWKAHIDRLVRSVQANLDVDVDAEIEIEESTAASPGTRSVPTRNPLRIIGLVVAGFAVTALLGFAGWRVWGAGQITSDQGTSVPESVEPGSNVRTESAGVTTENEPLKVGLITDYDEIYENAFNQSVWEGVQKAQEELGAEIDLIETREAEDYAAYIDRFANEGFDVIITAGFYFQEATNAAAKKYPEIRFIAIDQPASEKLENVAALIFEADQIGFLAGALSGLLTRTDSVAMILGPEELEPIVAAKEGFEAGVAYIDSIISIISTYHPGEYTVSINDPEWGADVVSAFAAKTGKGALMETARRDGVYCIGTEEDIWSTWPGAQPWLVTSAVRHVNTSVFDLITLAQEGAFPSGTYHGDIGLAPYRDFEEALSQDAKDQIAEICDKLAAGRIDTGYEAGETESGTQSTVEGTESAEVENVPQSIQSVLAYIEQHEPTFEDDFSTPKSEWGTFPNGYGVGDQDDQMQHISDVVFDGVLHVEGAVQLEDDSVNTYFPSDDMFRARNLVMEFDYRIESTSEEGKHGVSLRGPNHHTLSINIEKGVVTAWGEDSNNNLWHESIPFSFLEDKRKIV
jgi:basic membrane protein A